MSVQAMKVNKNRRWYALNVFILLGFSSLIYFLLRNAPKSDHQSSNLKLLKKKTAYFMPLKIRGFCSADIPYLEAMVENKTILTKLDLGYEGMFSLMPDILKELNKKEFIKRTRCYGVRGKIYEEDVYRIEEIEIDGIVFSPIKVEEKNLEFVLDGQLKKEEEKLPDCYFGRIGWHLFSNVNLLVDCKHSMIALCDSLETLKEQGYPVDSFTETPLLLDDGSIEFEAMTEAGPLHCILDTGSTLNLLNKDLKNGCNEHMIFTGKEDDPFALNPENKDLLTFDLEDTEEIASFKIGKKEFGPLRVNHMRSPISVDAIIGMEFIDSMLIFIDFFNRKIYFFEYPPEEESSSAEFLVKGDRLLFLRLLSLVSRLPACGISPPHPTCFCLLNMRLPAFLALTPSNVSHLSLTPPFNCSAAEHIGS